METSDARKLVGAALEERRKSVIRLHQSGKYKTYQEIAEVSGVHRKTTKGIRIKFNTAKLKYPSFFIELAEK